jgi:hypothetical protein
MFADRDYARRLKSKEIRVQASDLAHDRPHPEHPVNGEEYAYAFLGSYHKGLPHDALGEVQPSAYRGLVTALTTADPADFEKIPLGTPGPTGRKLTNPQAGLAFDLEGPDGHAMLMPPAPRIDDPEGSGEMGELYWMAVLRDVHFSDYQVGTLLVDQAVASLNADFSDFRGPKQAGLVTPQTLFRGITPGDVTGPYLSQFLLKGTADADLGLTEKDGFIRFGTLRIDQRNKVARAGKDYMTIFADWLEIQNGVNPALKAAPVIDEFEPAPLFMRNLRDLATYVHFDQLYEAYFNACLLLLENGAPLDPGNPYAGVPSSQTQLGFGTFGGPHILSLVTEVASRALKAVWYQKWYVHRRLRPEAFGGLIHNHLASTKSYPMIDSEILTSLLTGGLSATFGPGSGYLLPMAFPEGSPTHPAYGAGHATVAGACVTILKAWFDETAAVPSPVVASTDGLSLVDYTGPDAGNLTIGGELNKLAANIGIGRNAAGVHWRSDYTESIKLGEVLAIGILQEQSLTYNEKRRDGALPSFSFTRFEDGATVRIENGTVSITP